MMQMTLGDVVAQICSRQMKAPIEGPYVVKGLDMHLAACSLWRHSLVGKYNVRENSDDDMGQRRRQGQ
jgi:hypothetical protein